MVGSFGETGEFVVRDVYGEVVASLERAGNCEKIGEVVI